MNENIGTLTSWHVHLVKKMVTHTTAQDADVIMTSPGKYVCLDCMTLECLHIGLVKGFRSLTKMPAGGVVRKDTNNPHAITKLENMPLTLRKWILGDKLEILAIARETLKQAEALKQAEPQITPFDVIEL